MDAANEVKLCMELQEVWQKYGTELTQWSMSMTELMVIQDCVDNVVWLDLVVMVVEFREVTDNCSSVSERKLQRR